MQVRLLAVLPLLIAAGGCGPSRPPDPLAASRLPKLTLTEISRVGGKDERAAYMLSSVVTAAVLGPDAWALIDGGSKQVRIYGTDGTVRRVVGGDGKGPGQFSFPGGLGATAGGDLLVWDMMQQRITRFDSTGALAGTASLPVGDMTAVFSSAFVGALPDGSWVLQRGVSPLDARKAPDGPRRDTTRFEHIAADGKKLGEIAAVQGPERVVMSIDGRSGEQTPIFGRQVVAAVSGDTLLVGITDSLRLMRFLPDGRALPPLVFDRPPHPVDKEDVEAQRAFLVKRAEDMRNGIRGSFPKDLLDQEIQHMKDVAEGVPAEPTWPAFQGLRTGPGGDVWVEDPSPPETTTTRWIRFDAGFRPVGWIELPEKSYLLGVGDGLALVRTTDELDLQTVVCYRVGAAAAS